jgi:site-specific recombinase XerD
VTGNDPTTPTPDHRVVRDKMRADLIAQGYDPAVVEQMLGGAAPAGGYLIRDAVADGLRAMHQDLPRSVKTWGPYLQVLSDGLPHLCPCPCPTCASGPCPCDEAAGEGGDGHAPTCSMPTGEPHTSCADRFAGLADTPVSAITRGSLSDAAWWVERRGLKRVVARNVKRELGGRNLLHSDGRGGREQFIQASRWLFTWLIDEERAQTNPALKIKLPARQEAPARSLDAAEFVEVYGVAVSTGRDPALDGLLLRHLLIQAVRRSGLLDLTCGGLDVKGIQIKYWDQKKNSWRTRPTTATHLADLITHVIARGPRVAAPLDAPENERRHGVPVLSGSAPVFYGRPVDTFDADGYFLSRQVHPITRKRIEGLFNRIRRHLPWTERVELRCHDIRHTSGRLIYKAADQQMAKLHLAHDGGSTTDHYLKERLEELAKLKEQLFELPTEEDGEAGAA